MASKSFSEFIVGDLGTLAISISDERFGEWLRARRHASGLSLRDAARRIGVSATAFQKWENGTIHPRANKVERLVQLFDNEGAEDVIPKRSALRPQSAARPVSRTPRPSTRPAPEAVCEETLLDRIDMSKRAIANAAGVAPGRVKIIIEY